jgi:hypothetical protein
MWDEGYAINIIPLPLVDAPGNVITCNSYTLPDLTYGDYYTSSNGGALNLLPEPSFLHLQRFLFLTQMAAVPSKIVLL